MSRYATCPVCGHRMSRVKDMWGNWDGETYECNYCSGGSYDDDYDDGDGGCAACGNPAYPDCKTSCPMFDD